jgi:hypothetical protein
MTLATFIATYNGTYASYYGGTYQCMDLYRLYVQNVWQLPQTPGVIGAYQVYGTLDPTVYELIPNTPSNYPLPGDVVCWNESFSPYGHIAIVNTANVSTMQVFEENDPIGSVCKLGTHGYTDVIGWFRPINGYGPTPPGPIQPIGFNRYVILNGQKYPVQTDTYKLGWQRAFSSQLAGNILRLNFVDRGPGLRTYDMSLILRTWNPTDLPYFDGITQTYDEQLANLELSYGLQAQILPFTDISNRSPGPVAQNGVFFIDYSLSIPKYATNQTILLLAKISLVEATQLVNGGQN